MMDKLNNIRLTNQELNAIIECFKQYFLATDGLWLFGSRTNPHKKGGDIDLYIETHIDNLDDAIQAKTNFIWCVEQKIGEQKIDVVLHILHIKNKLPVYNVAREEGIKLV